MSRHGRKSALQTWLHRIDSHKVVPATLLLSLLAGCGGGGGGASAGGGATAGIDRLGVQAGTVVGFGSIILDDGEVYQTDDAEFDIDDDNISASEADLSVGDVVAILVSSDAPNIALRVVSDEIVEGPVEAIDPVAGTLTVVGQPVFIDEDTRFDDDIPGRSLDGISIGDRLEISGFLESDGRIRATLIDDDDDGDDIEVHGIVADLDTTNFTFRISDLIVDYSSAELDDDLPNGQPEDGLRVEVSGDSYDGTTLIADEVDPDGIGFDAAGRDIADIDEDDIEGVVSNLVAGSSFSIEGVTVLLNAATQYEDGSVGNLANGVRVEVEGYFNGMGDFTALEVEFEDDFDDDGTDDDDGSDDDSEIGDDAFIEGRVKNLVGDTSFEIGGTTVLISEATLYVEGTSEDLANGVIVEVDGVLNDANDLIAEQIEFESDD